MINVSKAFRRNLYNSECNFLIRLVITLQDGTVLNVANDNIMNNGILVDDAVSEDDDFTALGATIINACNVILYNNTNLYSNYEFNDADVVLYIGALINDTVEEFKKGTYTVEDAVYGEHTVTLSLVDEMAQFDRPYSESQLIYPATLNDIVLDACNVCGVTLATSSLRFPHRDFSVAVKPNEESTTFREVIGWAAAIAGCFARCNVDGELEFKWFNISALDTAQESSYDGGTFDPWSAGDEVDGGTFDPWSEGDTVNGGNFNFLTSANVHYISSLYSQSLGVDDVVITGVRITVEVEDLEVDENTKIFMAGTDDYLIDIENNKFITINNAATVLEWLSTLLIGTRFRKCTVKHPVDPTIEAGDVALLWDTKEVEHRILITRVDFSPNKAQTIVSGAASVGRNTAARFSNQTKAFVATRKQFKQQKDTYDLALEQLSNKLDNANGLYKTEVEQQDGSIITYYHSKPNLKDSDIQIVISDVGITVTSNGTDETPVWYGLEVNGTLIASIMNTIGINFDWGVGGELIIKKDNNETLYVNADTGEVRIKASSFSLASGDTIYSIAEETANSAADSALSTAKSYTDTAKQDAISSASYYTDTKLSDYSNQVDAVISDLQDQIDGQIESWYYDYEPTLNNEPAVNWTTESDRKAHEGDTFYWESTGYAYRFTKLNNVWQWKLIEDSQVTQAIAMARAAQEIANSKRRIFTTTPTPPYDIGDLWAQGSDGDILKCRTAKTAGQSYSESDWIKASKYTDDTVVNNLQIGGRNLFINTNISNVSTAANRPRLKGQTQNTAVNGTAQVAEHGIRSQIGATAYRPYIRFGSSSDSTATMNGLIAGKTYTLSFDCAWKGLSAMSAGSTSSVVVNVYDDHAVQGSLNWRRIQTIATAEAGVEGSGRCEATFTLADNVTMVCLVVTFENTNKTNYATGDYIELTNLKLEVGNKATAWTPASEDIEAEISALEADLQSQIDGKIQTWYQSADPSTSWTAEEKLQHAGDLWYKTTDGTTWRYTSSEWQEQTASAEVFDAIDGKTTIFYGTPAQSYTGVQTGDYLVDSTDGSTYRWSGSSWVTVTDYVTAIDNIEIGGKNKLTGTNSTVTLTTTGQWADRTWRKAGYGDGTISHVDITDAPDKSLINGWQINVTSVSSTAFIQALCIRQNGVKIVAGQQYTMSCYAKGSGQLFMFCGVSAYKGARFTVTDAWQRYSTTFTAGTTEAYVTDAGASALFGASVNDASIIICGMQLESGNKVSAWNPAPEDVDNKINAIREYADSLKTQLDGKAETWYQADDPSTEWTATQKAEHEGDLWYRTSDGKTLRYTGSVWVEQSVPNEVFDKIDGKAQVFTTKPKVPYFIGDLWVEGPTGDIYRCLVTRKTGNYTASDWGLASKYTDDSKLDTFINGTYATTISNIRGQLDAKIETFYQATDPSTDWTTTALKNEHNGDLWYRTTDNTTHRWNGSKWVAQNVPTAVFDRIDGKARIFVKQPTVPYSIGDLWVQGATGEIYRCTTARASGNYTASDWEKASKYTDDSALTSFVNGDYATFVTTANAGINTAQSTANSKITTYYQASAPTSHKTGDLWIDTDDGNKLHRYNGSKWVAVQDTAIQSALTAAGDAQSTADSKIITFAQAAAPTATDVGDLWIDTDDNNKMYRWNGSEWKRVTDNSGLKAFQNGTYATFVTNTNTAINSKITTFYQAARPTAKATGDLWIDTDDNNKLYRWNGSSWASVRDAGIQTAIIAAGDAQATADSKIITFAQASQPTATDVGDLWIDTDDNNKMYRWSGSNWVAYTDISALNTFINGTYATTISEVRGQIDAKAETWYQSSNPAANWTTAALKASHTGDLWYRTTDGKTFRYNGSSWTEQTVPTEVFDKIDGKARIFVSQPTTPYDVGDLWVQGTSGDILRCKTARTSGDYSSDDWEKASKYTDDSAVTSLDTSLTQQEIFNRLTNNGQTQGIYLQSGKLYINSSYIGTGTLQDTQGNIIWNLTTGAMTAKKLAITSTNFTLTSSGLLTASGATINGVIRTISGNYKSEMSGGYFKCFYDDEQLGILSTVVAGSNKYLSLRCQSGADALSFGIGNTGYIFINNGGNPNGYTERLQFSGSIHANSSMTITDAIYLNNAKSAYVDYVGYTGGTAVVRIAPNAQIGTATFVSGSRLTVGGSIYAYGAVTENSDERRKIIDSDDWKELADDFVQNLDVIKYQWKDGTDSQKHIGLGAQRTEKTLAEAGLNDVALVKHVDDIYGVNYSELAPMMVPTLQKDRKTIKQLENRIEELEDRIAKLESIISNLI